MLLRVSPPAGFPSLGFPRPLACAPPFGSSLPPLPEPKLPVTSATPGEKRGGARWGAWGGTTFPPSSWNCRPASASSLFHSPSGRTVVALRATGAAAAQSAGNSAAGYRPAASPCECMCVRVRECAYVCCAGATW